MSKSISVDMPSFTITVNEGGQLSRTIRDCSFGRHDGDPTNLTPIMATRLSDYRDKDHKSSEYAPGGVPAPMNYALFLWDPAKADVSNCAFHEGETSSESHGCIHLNGADAAWLFAWAGDDAVAVTIAGPHPDPGTRASVYKVGGTNMLPRVIRAINEKLAAAVGLNKAPDDIYDSETEDAVKRFQHAAGVPEDGKVGDDTAPLLGIER
jgi:hypothetical protein